MEPPDPAQPEEATAGESSSSEEDSDDGSKSGRGSHGARDRPPAVPSRRMSPFDLRFSQLRARSEFRDGRKLSLAIGQIRVVRCDGAEDSLAAGDSGHTVPGDSGGGEVWRLEAPFPPIEVLPWRCKLRDERTGRPRIDPKTGGEFVDQERWFSLDNRRLYCLQKVAASIWPKRAVVDVVELPPGSLTSQRQIKKFRTLDRGCSILIGHRAQEEGQLRWSWREVLGLAAEEGEPDASTQVQMRRRPRREHPLAPQAQRRRPPAAERHERGEEAGGGDSRGAGGWGGDVHPFSSSGLLLIVLVYLALRTSVSAVAALYDSWR